MIQEIVVYLPIGEEQSRSKAMTIASKIKGVIKVEIIRERNQLLVIGEEIDSVSLAKSLRKKFCFANIVRVRNATSYSSETSSEESGFDEDDFQNQRFHDYYPTHQYYYPPPQPTNYMMYPVQNPDPPPCSIM